MKVYSLTYIDYDETHLVGVFATEQQAEAYRDKYVKDSTRTFGSITSMSYKPDYFDIEVWELDEDKGL